MEQRNIAHESNSRGNLLNAGSLWVDDLSKLRENFVKMVPAINYACRQRQHSIHWQVMETSDREAAA